MTPKQQAARYVRDSVPAAYRCCGEAVHFEGAYLAGWRARGRASAATKAERAVVEAERRLINAAVDYHMGPGTLDAVETAARALLKARSAK